MLWIDCVRPNLYVGVLTPSTLACDLGNMVFTEVSKLKQGHEVGSHPI